LDWKVALSTFVMIFLAELGDKTQLALFSFAAKTKASISVLVGGAAALFVTTALAVAFGDVITRYVPSGVMKWMAGCAFIAFGIWTLFSKQ